MNTNPKVLVIGLDGAAWRLIESWSNQGRLKNFEKIMNAGVYGKLKSTIPPISPPAWASVVTGVNPGKHSVFDFFERTDVKEGGERRDYPISSRSIRAKKLWEYMDEYNKQSIIVNFPLMYPPEKIKGITISGFITPNRKTFTYPEGLSKELENKGYNVEINEDDLFKLLHSDKEKLFRRFIEIMDKRAEITMDLMNKYDWEFFMVVFGESDRIQHYFFDNEMLLFECYKKLDDVVGKFIELVDDDTLILIVSDHGFSRIYKYFYINTWFKNKGLLFIEEAKRSKKLLSEIGLSRDKIISLLERVRAKKLIEFIPGKIGRLIPDSILRLSEVDMSKTKAHCVSAYGYIDVDIPTSNGEEYEALRNHIIKELYEVRDPENGNKVIEKVFKKEDLYSDPYVKTAPDLVVKTKESYFLHYKFHENKMFEFVENAVGLTKRTGEHEENGILLAVGPNIKKGVEIKDATVYDVTPTILHIFGIPIPSYIDGRVLDALFEQKSELAKRKIEYQKIDAEKERERVKSKIKKLRGKGKI